MTSNGLTQQQENFCKLYVKFGIGYKAYIQAYPKAKTWTRNAVDCACSKMLKRAKIQQRISELNDEIESTLQTSITLNKRKLLETALQMLQDTNNPQERGHAVNLIKLLFNKEGMTNPENVTQVNVQNNTIMGEISHYLDI